MKRRRCDLRVDGDGDVLERETTNVVEDSGRRRRRIAP